MRSHIARLADDIFVYQVAQPQIVSVSDYVFDNFTQIMNGMGIREVIEAKGEAPLADWWWEGSEEGANIDVQ
jgi:hypothetical protein